jgi:hypothetical protein
MGEKGDGRVFEKVNEKGQTERVSEGVKIGGRKKNGREE